MGLYNLALATPSSMRFIFLVEDWFLSVSIFCNLQLDLSQSQIAHHHPSAPVSPLGCENQVVFGPAVKAVPTAVPNKPCRNEPFGLEGLEIAGIRLIKEVSITR